MTQHSSQTLGKYQILEELGRGGFATVYRARDTRLGCIDALKVLDPLLMRDDANVQRFWREAQAAAALRHPNIVRILDVAEDAGRIFISAEYMPGGSLKQNLAGRPASLSATVAVVEHVGAALDHAHEEGLVHRDVKPSNILYDGYGVPHLADFGIAKAFGEGGLTTTGAAVGTPEYMAPEQAEGHPVDGRTDIYALGVVAYQMLTGRVPFTGETPSAVHYQHVHTPPLPPNQANPDLPEAVSSAVLKALAKDPAARYQTGAEFAAALRAAVEADRQAEWARYLRSVERLLSRGELGETQALVERLARLRPEDPGLVGLQAHVEEEMAVTDAYRRAGSHLDAARQEAHRVLSLRPDHPDPDGLLAALGLRSISKPRKRMQLTAPLVTSQLRGVGLAGALLLQMCGLVGGCAVLLVTLWETGAYGGTIDTIIPNRSALGWAAAAAVLAGMVLSALLSWLRTAARARTNAVRPAGLWSVAAPLAATGLGLPLAIGLLRRWNWARRVAQIVLPLFGAAACAAAIWIGLRSFGAYQVGSTSVAFVQPEAKLLIMPKT